VSGQESGRDVDAGPIMVGARKCESFFPNALEVGHAEIQNFLVRGRITCLKMEKLVGNS